MNQTALNNVDVTMHECKFNCSCSNNNDMDVIIDELSYQNNKKSDELSLTKKVHTQ
jgi:hypothetical protein